MMAGILVIGIGLYFAIGGSAYRMGSLSRMGPGFVPVSLGVLAIILGTAICIAAFRTQNGWPQVNWRQVLCVLVSVPVFALLLERIGMIPAAFLSVLVASAALPQERPFATLALAAVVAIGAWAVFVLALGMPIDGFAWRP